MACRQLFAPLPGIHKFQLSQSDPSPIANVYNTQLEAMAVGCENNNNVLIALLGSVLQGHT